MSIRLLVVDDSAFARKVLRHALGRDERIEVVGHARDGMDALEQIDALDPDVVTLDLSMPRLDGLGVLDALAGRPRPRCLVVSISGPETEAGLEALSRGAVDVVAKPTALATDRLYEISDELVEKVLAAAEATPRRATVAPPEDRPVVGAAERTELVVVGTSTGGPQALTRLLTGLPAGFPVPLAIVLHIPAGYTDPLARRLDELSAVTVREAVDGEPFQPGVALVAPGDRHLRVVRREGRPAVELSYEPSGVLHRPSVDELFASAARVVGAGTLGAVLTGMGDDGVAGARLIQEAGGRVLTEAAQSCIVDGMPRRVREAGLSSGEAPIEGMAGLLVERL